MMKAVIPVAGLDIMHVTCNLNPFQRNVTDS